MEKEELLDKIKSEMKSQKISFREMSEMVGFSVSNLQNIFNSTQRLHLDFYLKACEVLKKHPCDFFDGSYLMDKKSNPPVLNEPAGKYAKPDLENYVKREDYLFLQRQLEVLNQIIIKKL